MVIDGFRIVQVSKMGKPNGLEKQVFSLQNWSALSPVFCSFD